MDYPDPGEFMTGCFHQDWGDTRWQRPGQSLLQEPTWSLIASIIVSGVHGKHSAPPSWNWAVPTRVRLTVLVALSGC